MEVCTSTKGAKHYCSCTPGLILAQNCQYIATRANEVQEHAIFHTEFLWTIISQVHESNIKIDLFPAWGKVLWAFRVRKPLSMGSFLMEIIFWSTPNEGLTAHTYWVTARCATEAFSATCAVHIEDFEGWWSSSCHDSVAEHWRLKLEVSWVRLPAAADLFNFLYFAS